MCAWPTIRKSPVMTYWPTAGERMPAMVLCPGGIGTGLFEILEWLAAGLRDQGICAVTINYRAGSPDDDAADVSLVREWLARDPRIDPERIGVMGMSRGGNAALRAAAFDPRLKVVVTFGPATDFLQQAEGTAIYAPGRHQMLRKWLGDPVADRAYYEKIQAITYADRIKQPALMVHGQHDMHAPPEQSIWMKEAMERAGNDDVRLKLVPMMGHYGDVVPNSYGFDTLRGIIIPFLKQRL